MPIRRLLVLAFIAGLPGIAGAQFTTFIPPQNKVVDSIKAVVVAQERAQTDSAVSMQLTNMKTWVDSAAGIVAPPPRTTADSLAQRSTITATTAAESTFRNGARAPATASALPLFALLGLFSLTLGVYLVRSEPARQRSRERA